MVKLPFPSTRDNGDPDPRPSDHQAQLAALRQVLSLHPAFEEGREPLRVHVGPRLFWLGWLVQLFRRRSFGARFQGGVVLLRFAIEQTRLRLFTMDFQWYAPKLQPGWAVFVHFLDDQGEIRFLGDYLLDGIAPDRLGFIYLRRTVSVPGFVPSGLFRVRVGVWSPDEKRHLRLLRYRGCERERPGWCHNAVLLGTVKV